MCLLFESVKVINNTLINVDFHNERIARSRIMLFNAHDRWDLRSVVKLPELKKEVVYKCRITYSGTVDNIEFIPYKKRRINRLVIVHDDNIEYSYKFTDRKELESLKNRFAPDENSDILIVKRGLITDSSFSNIVFFDGSKWLTPALPLLKGTQRAFCLNKKVISETVIMIKDLKFFTSARLINAMIDLDDSYDISISEIK